MTLPQEQRQEAPVSGGATTGPWKIRRGFRGGYEIYAPDKGIKRPFQPTEVATVDDSHDNWRENARRIVQCVNSHDELAKALAELADYARGFSVSGVYLADEIEGSRLLDQADRALAATGKAA